MQATGAILLVEDDEQVRGFVRSLLRSEGYTILEASDGAEGLRIGTDHEGGIDLLLTDMLLPELSGIDLAQQLSLRHPGLKVLFMTGYVEGEIVQRAMHELDATFIDKPFQPAALLDRVRESIAKGPIQANAS